MSVAETIETKLRGAFSPRILVVTDESHRHAGHAGAKEHALRRGNAGAHGETHFHVEIETAAFAGMNRVARQRLIYDLLKDEIAAGVHALSLETRAPGEASRQRIKPL